MPDIQTDIVRFRTSLPFHPSERQVIYVEEAYHQGINEFLRNHYARFREGFTRAGYEFCYFPYLSRELSGEEFVRYFTPYQSSPANQPLDSTCLLPFLKTGHKLSPSLLVYDGKKSDSRSFAFHAFRLDGQETALHTSFASCIRYLEERKKHNPPNGYSYCATSEIKGDEAEGDADNGFSQEVVELMKEVRDKIDCLRQHGVNEMVLHSLLNPQIKLSRLHITRNGRILLPDYGNMEIKMPPLVKSVFFLFLHHPEGIIFKSLPDYRRELYGIYTHLTGRLSNEAVRQSIIDVTDPCKNSINEKCARIREAFIREFDDRLAGYYYVTGHRGEAKNIRLPRKLVTWEE